MPTNPLSSVGASIRSYLVFGTNVIAAEIHQSGGGGPDISFDLELSTARAASCSQLSQSASVAGCLGRQPRPSRSALNRLDPLRYQWRFNGSTLVGATNSALVFPGITTNHAGAYFRHRQQRRRLVTSAVATVTVSVLDTDGDGIPDLWETAHGSNPQVNDAALDPDHDGMTNLQEYLAGTDPQDANSYLKVQTLAWATNGWLVSFMALSNHSYSLLSKDALDGTQWLRISNLTLRATNRMELILDSRATPQQRYYRLVTPSMP